MVSYQLTHAQIATLLPSIGCFFPLHFYWLSLPIIFHSHSSALQPIRDTCSLCIFSPRFLYFRLVSLCYISGYMRQAMIPFTIVLFYAFGENQHIASVSFYYSPFVTRFFGLGRSLRALYICYTHTHIHHTKSLASKQ